MSIFLDLLPLKLCGKEGHPQRPDMQHMQRGRGNPASNNLSKHLRKLLFTQVYVKVSL